MSDSQNNEDQPQGSSFEDIQSDYANNVAFESTVWDLKLLFGEYSDRSKGVDWHTSVTIPWAQAKLMLYYLKVNVESHEIQRGNISLPFVPPEPPPPPDMDNPVSKAIYEMVQRNRKEFLPK